MSPHIPHPIPYRQGLYLPHVIVTNGRYNYPLPSPNFDPADSASEARLTASYDVASAGRHCNAAGNISEYLSGADGNFLLKPETATSILPLTPPSKFKRLKSFFKSAGKGRLEEWMSFSFLLLLYRDFDCYDLCIHQYC